MTTNRLAKSAEPERVSNMRAIDWYHLAVEKGHREAAHKWWQEAVARGEVSNSQRGYEA